MRRTKDHMAHVPDGQTGCKPQQQQLYNTYLSHLLFCGLTYSPSSCLLSSSSRSCRKQRASTPLSSIFLFISPLNFGSFFLFIFFSHTLFLLLLSFYTLMRKYTYPFFFNVCHTTHQIRPQTLSPSNLCRFHIHHHECQ